MEAIPGDNDDDEVQVLFADVKPTSSTKLNNIILELELLQAFCNNRTPIPLDYSKFYNCAKQVNSKLSDPVILSAWKRALSKQISMLKENQGSLLPQTSPSPVIDLTEPSTASTESKLQTAPPVEPHFSPITLSKPQFSSSDLKTDSFPFTNPQTTLSVSSTLGHVVHEVNQETPIPVTRNVMPIALFANPHFQNTIKMSSQSVLDIEVTNHSLSFTGDCNQLRVENPDNPSSNLSCDSELRVERRSKHYLKNNNLVKTSVFNKKCEETINNCVINSHASKLKETIKTSSIKLAKSCSYRNEDKTNSYFRSKSLKEALNNNLSSSTDDSEDSATSDESANTNGPKFKALKLSYNLGDSVGNENFKVMSSHVGVQANIQNPEKCAEKSKSDNSRQKSSNTKHKKRKKKSKNYMSEAEFKKFKIQQQKRKIREYRKLQTKELEIVHNRLVDVLIPKYYNK